QNGVLAAALEPSVESAESTQMPQKRSSIELTSTLRRVKVPSFVAASDGTITWGNDAAKRMFGDLRGRSFTTVVVPEDVPGVRQHVRHGLRALGAHSRLEAVAKAHQQGLLRED